MIKKIFVWGIFATLYSLSLSAQNITKRAYTLFNAEGKEVTYPEMIESLAQPDVVFIGEYHNCCITHWLELQITQSLYTLHGEGLTLGAEMLEWDNQLILDEYLNSDITQDRFEEEARLWPNYSTDYYPVVFFAKEHKIPFIATNVPRRYANTVKNKSLTYLDSLSSAAKTYLPPLPIRYENRDEEAAMFAMMRMMGGKSQEKSYLSQAQALKDATMGWRIAQTLRKKYVHLNGSYHSLQNGGIIPYLLQYRPGTTYQTVTTVKQDDIDQLDPAYLGQADFYICVPSDMTTTY